MKKCLLLLLCLAFLGTLFLDIPSVIAQTPIKQFCNASPKPAWCNAVRGDRASSATSRLWLPQGRSEVMAQRGIVSTSEPHAAQAGLRILMAGGNAIDAAVATAATLNLTEPMNVGLAGDLFVIIYIARENKLYQLNASGIAPAAATLKLYNDIGYYWDPTDWAFGSGMPPGIMSVTVPGSIWGWDEVLRRFGTMTFNEVLQPAIDYAENGFPVSEIIGNWSLPRGINCSPATGCRDRDPDAIAAWYVTDPGTGLPRGPLPGEIFKNPDLAKTFRLIQKYGRDVFYKGEIAQAIVAKAEQLAADSGGKPWFTMQDLANYKGEWVTPPTTNYRGYDVYETMAPSQAWNTLEMLNILEVCMPIWSPNKTLADLGPKDPLYWHFLVEAKKIAYEDLYSYNSDPNTWTAKQKAHFQKLLTKEYALTLCPKSNANTVYQPKLKRGWGEADTIYLTTADRWGNMVSWVNSNYAGFGSGIGIKGYGFVLHNRGRQFTLDPLSPNVVAPNKRPYNTISAGFVTKDGKPLMTLGLMGGDMQVQGHAQMLVNILDLGANLQASTDMARFYHDEVTSHPTGTLSLESELFKLPVPGFLTMADALRAKGHNLSSSPGASVGGYQAIMFTPDPTASVPEENPGRGHAWGNVGKELLDGVEPVNGVYRAGSDHRKDGHAVGW